MPAYKVAYFFESMQQGFIGTGASLGWVETWYWQADLTIEAAMASNEIQRYLVERCPILDPLYRIAFIRISQDDQPRRFKVAHVNFQGSASRDPNATAMQVQCAILVDMERLPLVDQPKEKVHHRRFLLRGLPPDVINGNVINPHGQNWQNVLRFLNFISNKPARGGRGEGMPARSEFGIRYLAPNVEKKIITLLECDAADGLTIRVTASGFVPTQGQSVVVSGVRSPLGVNRTWKCLAEPAPGAGGFSILGTARRKLQGTYNGPGSGRVYIPSYLYGPLDQYAIIGLRSKKTGRVFRQLRGRSSRA